MSFELISIIALLLAIVIGVRQCVNIGVMSMFFAFFLGQFVFGINIGKLIVQGWPTGLFFIMLSVMLLFAFATTNGTAKLLAFKLAYSCRNFSRLLPWVFMLATGFLTFVGADPTVVAFMLPIALLAGEKSNINPVILMVMLIAGADIGSAGPFSVIGVVTSGLARDIGVNNYFPIWAATATCMVLHSIIVYVVLGGWKAKTSEGSLELEKPEPFNKKQKITLAIIAIVLGMILLFKVPIGAAMFIGVALMSLARVSDEKEALKSVNWNVLIMVGGTGILITLMKQVGGIDAIAQGLATVMTPQTATPLIALIGGLMTSVSSGTGVVMPALIPTVPSLVTAVGGDLQAIHFVQAIQSGAIGSVVYSPLSPLGAIALASLPTSYNTRKYFMYMMFAAIGALIVTLILNWSGLFKLYV